MMNYYNANAASEELVKYFERVVSEVSAKYKKSQDLAHKAILDTAEVCLEKVKEVNDAMYDLEFSTSCTEEKEMFEAIKSPANMKDVHLFTDTFTLRGAIIEK